MICDVKPLKVKGEVKKQMKEKNWLGTVLSFAEPCRFKMIMSVICAIISVGGGIVPYIGVYQIIVLFFEEKETVNSILFWSVICLIAYIIQLIFYAISTTLAHISAYSILEQMRLKMADKLMKAPLGVVVDERIGKLKSAMIDRVETIELPLAHLIPEGISNLLLPIGVFIYLIMIDWRMALASLITVPIASVVYGIMMRSFNKQYADFMTSSDHVNSVIVEYVEGIEVIKAFNQSTSSYAKFAKAVDDFKAYTLNWFRSTWKLMHLGGSILPSTLLGTIPVGMYLSIKGSLSPAEFTICLILALGIVGPLTSFTVFVNHTKSIEYAVKDTDKFLNLKELQSASETIKLPSYDMQLENVTFSYDTNEVEEDRNENNSVLKGITHYIEEGSFTALVGPSGGGKSTVARLMARFFEVEQGFIKIGGIDIKKLPLSQLADTISFVTQDNFLFNSSIMENIRLGYPKASDEEVFWAAQAACCHDFIQKLDKGYDTHAGEAGGKLSGGEKQRIAIARAILKNAPIVILDEATAFTDPENEDKLQRSIAALTKGKTLLVIAHRLSTIKNADTIIVIDKGEIVGEGTHEELIAGCRLYKEMWEAHIGAKKWAVGHEKRGGKEYV